jgi:hypothetical protein
MDEDFTRHIAFYFKPSNVEPEQLAHYPRVELYCIDDGPDVANQVEMALLNDLVSEIKAAYVGGPVAKLLAEGYRGMWIQDTPAVNQDLLQFWGFTMPVQAGWQNRANSAPGSRSTAGASGSFVTTYPVVEAMQSLFGGSHGIQWVSFCNRQFISTQGTAICVRFWEFRIKTGSIYIFLAGGLIRLEGGYLFSPKGLFPQIYRGKDVIAGGCFSQTKKWDVYAGGVSTILTLHRRCEEQVTS